ncbi:hypothetical protein NKG05_17615 [Oerskovia sp. M15]
MSQVARATGRGVPERLVRPLDVADPEYGYLPEIGAVALAEYLEEAVGDRTVVLLADDLHLVDEISRAVIVGLVAQRRASLVLLATAAPDGFERPLPYPIEVRELAPSDRPRRCTSSSSRSGSPSRPTSRPGWRRSSRATRPPSRRPLGCSPPSSWRGRRSCPTPASRPRGPSPPRSPARGAEARGASGPADRGRRRGRADRHPARGVGDEHRRGAGRPARGAAVPGLRTFRLHRPRVRALVHGEARIAERTAAHLRLATVHTAVGEEDIATWHTALATLAGDATLVPGWCPSRRGCSIVGTSCGPTRWLARPRARPRGPTGARPT